MSGRPDHNMVSLDLERRIHMADQDNHKSTVEKIKELPIGSGAVSLLGVLSLTETFNLGAAIFAAPLACAAVAINGAVNMCDKKRSGISRAFSAAAAVTGAVGAVLPFVLVGPEALGALIVSAAAMAVAGAFNVAGYFARNKKLPFSFSIKKNTPKPTTMMQ